MFFHQVYHDINTNKELFDKVFINSDGSPTDAYVQSSGGTGNGARAYCVLHLDFSIQVEKGPGTLSMRQLFCNKLNRALKDFCDSYHLRVSSWVNNDALVNLEAVAVAVSAEGHQLLVLVDEYDRSFNQLMREDPASYQEAVAPACDQRPPGFLRAFYIRLKSLPRISKTRVRSFTTGIAPVALTDSSGWNVAWSLTHKEEFAECCGFSDADVERGLSQFGLTDAQYSQAMRLVRKFYNSYKFSGESKPLYLAAYIIFFFKTLHSDRRRRRAILQERDESTDAQLFHYMKDDNVSLSHNVTSVLRSSSRAAVAALQDAFQASKMLAVPLKQFESPFTLAELSPRTSPGEDLVRVAKARTFMDKSTSLVYQRALSLLFYHGVLSVREFREEDAVVVLSPPNLLSRLDHFVKLEEALQADAYFLERLIESPSCKDVTLLVDAVLHGWDSGALQLDFIFSEQCLSSTIEAAVGGWLRTQPAVNADLSTGRGRPLDLGRGKLGYYDLMLQNQSKDSRLLLELKVVRMNAIVFNDPAVSRASRSKGDYVDPAVDRYINALSDEEKLDLLLDPVLSAKHYRSCQTVREFVSLALQQLGRYHRSVRHPVRSFVVVLVGTRSLVAEYVDDHTNRSPGSRASAPPCSSARRPSP